MERSDSGLEIVKYIREELKNSSIRIIILTGEVFGATQEAIVLNYDINDYLSKEELTNKRLFSALTSSLRAYIQIEILKKSNGL
jgi:ActR/RegA family two-component response regulator